MSEVDISEELPNTDDSAFAEDQQQNGEGGNDNHAGTTTISAPHGAIAADHVFVATSQGLLTAEQLQEAAGIKTTHIVIHDQTLNVDSSPTELKTPTTPLPPPTPATPQSKERGFRYQWDSSVHSEVLPVRCKNTNGELHKAKFGSGGRGKCIRTPENQWFTPNEFESMSGRASSKDWKRSIRYGGRTLQCLIEDGILQPHATSCTCAACCDDESVVPFQTGPVRLFVPYKRRKKDSESGPPSPPPKKARPSSAKSPPAVTASHMTKEGVVVSIGNGQALSRSITVANAENGETVHIVTTDSAGNIVTAGDAVVMTPIAIAPNPKSQTATVVSMDVSEQKQWWQLEEMTASLIQQAQGLKAMLEQVKQQSLISKDHALQQLRAHMEKEKQEALHAARLEAQMNLSRVLMEERAQRDLAVQQALVQGRAEMSDKLDSVTVVTEDKVSYNVTWPHQATQNNIENIICNEVDEEEEDSDKEK
ncbi:deformed epidermal autoregulatory factor 1 homolog isoform X1 [Haliotis rufescens]|uniref:deformed epidermal autoregulatory factor 1 homolog isoform X1 n=1 Tax=Haliotis rufescens TaxID=6454 RepID=UPI001EB0A2BA|nr:deformed epidermal autoregulatory factor 1 homolog isoform X1 [Haliotis rufescens]